MPITGIMNSCNLFIVNYLIHNYDDRGDAPNPGPVGSIAREAWESWEEWELWEMKTKTLFSTDGAMPLQLYLAPRAA